MLRTSIFAFLVMGSGGVLTSNPWKRESRLCRAKSINCRQISRSLSSSAAAADKATAAVRRGGFQRRETSFVDRRVKIPQRSQTQRKDRSDVQEAAGGNRPCSPSCRRAHQEGRGNACVEEYIARRKQKGFLDQMGKLECIVRNSVPGFRCGARIPTGFRGNPIAAPYGLRRFAHKRCLGAHGHNAHERLRPAPVLMAYRPLTCTMHRGTSCAGRRDVAQRGLRRAAPGRWSFAACLPRVRIGEPRWPANTVQHKVPRHPSAGRCGVYALWLDAGIGGMRLCFCPRCARSSSWSNSNTSRSRMAAASAGLTRLMQMTKCGLTFGP